MDDVMVVEVSDNIYSVCLEVFGSIHELRAEIDNTVRSKSIDGLILLDTLFHSGNGDDRFYSIQADQGEVLWSTFNIRVVKKSDGVRKKIAKVFATHRDLIVNSTLTSVQKRMLGAGIGI
ncbi:MULTISPECIES: type II toxin-antitoxin system RnlB family antitoxin [Bacillus]|uniref:type II toxin-antitoxin system RnlB family antitoxin n=1 Tax=Bacillus TaxID=1386 RepID=UPI001F0D6E8F|nr:MULTISPECIES: type II toxin-antitoxin system RnlB family antitoxin [Bacillus]MCH4866769.1 type II toxin-antitoxin system RnlB family antitoxin [Bacillus sp. 1006-3]MCL9628279.1 type II toxin-antitoxin system RnlB family antitoxin [Bacillus subtilis]